MKTPNGVKKRSAFSILKDLRMVSFLSFIVFILIWEIATTCGLIQPLFLPSPTSIIKRAIHMYSYNDFWPHIFASTRRVLAGFALAGAVAVPLGILLGSSRFLKAVVDPLLSFLRPLPSMSWIPLSLLWLGITEAQKYSIVFMGSLAPTILYTIEATRSIDPVLIRAARNLGAKNYAIMREVILPGALPIIISGLKVMLGIAWTCVISAELVAADEGLGFLIMNGKEYFRTDQVLLGMALISLTVIIIDVVFRQFEKRLIPWVEE